MKGDVVKRATFLCLSVAVLVIRFVLRSVFPGGSQWKKGEDRST